VEADHAHLRDAWKRLRQLASRKEQQAEPCAELRPLILDFGRELREHFTAEEEGGYFSALTEERPELCEQIERLRGEHREMIALVAELEAPPDGWNDGLPSTLLRLLDRFQQHERAEASMIQDFFGRDEGGEGS
jgi:hypothetical protein